MTFYTFSEIARNITTALGIIAGGIWTFWVFYRSRTFAGSLIITQTLKEVITLEEEEVSIAIIEVRVKNIGRREVDLGECYINAGVITDSIDPRERIYTIGTEPIKVNEVDEVNEVDKVDRENRVFPQPIFKDRQPIEPNEETREEIALVLNHSISFSKNPLFRVDVTFKANKKSWISKEKSWTEKSWTSGAIYKR
ncbi:MAG: hypothetical protein AB4352_05170 [Hormoscilla sp.]